MYCRGRKLKMYLQRCGTLVMENREILRLKGLNGCGGKRMRGVGVAELTKT